MTPKEFFDLVVRMRTAQKKYFRYNRREDLQESKYLEEKVDNEITRVQVVLHEQREPRINFD